MTRALLKWVLAKVKIQYASKDTFLNLYFFSIPIGKLTFWVAQAAKTLKNCKFALVDISTYRHKSENKIDNEFEVIRVRADVADLCLDKVPYHEGCKFVVPISKHLCGAATGYYYSFNSV